MNDETKAIWRRMPEEAKERVRQNASEMFPARLLVALWGAVDDFEQALIRREPWALRSEAERLKRERGNEVDQDALDETMVARVAAGDYGAESQNAVREVIESGRFGDRRATLRAARQAVAKIRGAA